MSDTPLQYDVFISFAHIDNETLSQEQEGWIAMLHHALRVRLAQLLGENPEIWRDPKLQGNDDFNEEIVSNLLIESESVGLGAVPSLREVRLVPQRTPGFHPSSGAKRRCVHQS